MQERQQQINLILNEVAKDSGKIWVAGYDNILHGKEAKEKMGIVFDECFFQNYCVLRRLVIA